MDCVLGCFNRPWNQAELTDWLDVVANAGYEAVGFMRHKGESLVKPDSMPTEMEELRQLAEVRGLKPIVALVSVNLNAPVEDAAEEFCHAIDNVAAFGGKHILTTGGKPDLVEQYYALMQRVCPHAEEAGVVVGLKPHGGLSASGRQCREAVERIGSDAFGIWYDPGNIIYYIEGKPEEDVKDVAPHVVGVCIKDCKEHNVMVTPGEGEVDFRGVLQVLADAGFNGPMIVECVGGKTPDEINDAAAATHVFLKELVEAV